MRSQRVFYFGYHFSEYYTFIDKSQKNKRIAKLLLFRISFNSLPDNDLKTEIIKEYENKKRVKKLIKLLNNFTFNLNRLMKS